MKDKQAGDPDGYDEGIYRLVVCNECFPTSNKVVGTKLTNVPLQGELSNDRRSKNHQPHVP